MSKATYKIKQGEYVAVLEGENTIVVLPEEPFIDAAKKVSNLSKLLAFILPEKDSAVYKRQRSKELSNICGENNAEQIDRDLFSQAKRDGFQHFSVLDTRTEHA